MTEAAQTSARATSHGGLILAAVLWNIGMELRGDTAAKTAP